MKKGVQEEKYAKTVQVLQKYFKLVKAEITASDNST